jgi:oligopeptide transport system permease protein
MKRKIDMSKEKQRKHAAFTPETPLATDLALGADEFQWLGPDAERQEEIARPSIGYWRDAMRRLFQNKAAVASMIILAFIMIMAVIVPLASPYTISEQHLTHTNKSFMFRDEADNHLHIFGTDDLGRDIFTRVWHGARTSLFIAYTAVFVNLIVGVVYGCVSGYFGGMLDNGMMRFVEIMSGIPYLIIVILMMTVLPPGVWTMIVAYAIVGWISMARITRGQILLLKNMEYVMAARALGATPGRIIFRHLIPNTLSIVTVGITLQIPSAIFTEAFLSFIGMGVPIPEASWGTLAQEGVRLMQTYPHQLFVPAFFISITMLSFNLLGDGLRDAFDPRLRK